MSSSVYRGWSSLHVCLLQTEQWAVVSSVYTTRLSSRLRRLGRGSAVAENNVADAKTCPALLVLNGLLVALPALLEDGVGEGALGVLEDGELTRGDPGGDGLKAAVDTGELWQLLAELLALGGGRADGKVARADLEDTREGEGGSGSLHGLEGGEGKDVAGVEEVRAAVETGDEVDSR